MSKQMTKSEIEGLVMGVANLFTSDPEIHAAVRTGISAILYDNQQSRDEAEAMVASYVYEFMQNQMPNKKSIWQSFISGSVAAVGAVATAALIETLHAEPKPKRKTTSRKRSASRKSSSGVKKLTAGQKKKSGKSSTREAKVSSPEE